MKYIKIVNRNSDILIINADNFFLRLKGLMGSTLCKTKGLLLTPCNQVHTHFMKGPIDVIYLTADNKVIHIEENVPPYRFGSKVKGAKKVLELMGGVSREVNIKKGDILIFKQA